MRRGWIGLWVGVFVVVTPAFSWADNTTAANARFLMHGERQADNMTAAITDRWYKTNLVAGRSYGVYAWAPGAEAGTAAPNLNEVAFFTDEGSTAASTVTTTDQEVDVDVPTGFNQVQTKIIPTTTGTHWLHVEAASTPGATYSVTVLVMETTLFSPWWFRNTGLGYDGFIEIRNNTISSVSVTVTAYASDGTTAGAPSTQVLPGNGTALVQVAGTLGAPDGFGSAQIAHTGPPGAITANITTLSATTGLSFDAPFAPRMAWGQLGKN